MAENGRNLGEKRARNSGGGVALGTEQEEDGLWGRLPTQPQAPFHQQYTLTPKAGELVVFPSWLVHHVEPQEGEERIAWSFNVVAAVSYTHLTLPTICSV